MYLGFCTRGPNAGSLCPSEFGISDASRWGDTEATKSYSFTRKSTYVVGLGVRLRQSCASTSRVAIWLHADVCWWHTVVVTRLFVAALPLREAASNTSANGGSTYPGLDAGRRGREHILAWTEGVAPDSRGNGSTAARVVPARDVSPDAEGMALSYGYWVLLA